MEESSRWYRDSLVIIACFVLTLCTGPFLVFTVFFTSFEADFIWSRTLISSVYSAFLLTAAFSNVVVGWLTDKYGPKLILVACGFIMGGGLALVSQVNSVGQFLIIYIVASLGVGAIYVVPFAIVQKLVSPKMVGLALGITTSGLAISRVIFTPIASILLVSFDWRVSYVVLGATTWALVSIAAVIISLRRSGELAQTPSKHQLAAVSVANGLASSNALTTEVGEGNSLKEIITTRLFLLTGIMFVLPITCNQMLLLHIVPFAEGAGIGKTAAATAVGLSGLFGVVGNITWPALSSKVSWRWLVSIPVAICSLTMAWLIATSSLWMLYLFLTFYTFFFFGHITTRFAFIKFLFGSQFLASVIGILQGTGALLSTITPLVAGYIYDTTESYNVAFLVAAILFAIAAFVAILLKRPS
ncbi:nitrate/nitrite transporter [Chloroflexota bacterium]